MYKKNKLVIINRCRCLRKEGFSIGEISLIVDIPKTTVYGYVKDIRLNNRQREKIENRRKELAKRKPNPRKGKCISGREISKPQAWSADLVHIVSHFMFDGGIEKHTCAYYNSNKSQIVRLAKLVYKAFRAKPMLRKRRNNTYVLSFYYVELAHYIKDKINKVFRYLNSSASREEKKIFLQAFFDDEGNIFYKSDKRRVRGYQKSLKILREVQKFLEDFNIKGRINKSKNEIEISGRKNLINFTKEINFSPEIYINPNRKNSIWKKKFRKRDILKMAMDSYRK